MNDIESWQRSVLTLPDERFFNLMWNYLGEIPTPYDKHTLIGRLVRFLNREDVRLRLLAMVTTIDARILTAISLLEGPDSAGPSIDQLFGLLHQELSILELSQTLVDLENRLLVYRSREAQLSRYLLNPVLEGQLQAVVCHPGHLIRSQKCTPKESEAPWLQSSLLLAFLSHLIHREVRVRKDGNFNQKCRDETLRVFPVLKPEGRISLLRSALSALDMIQEERARALPVIPHWEAMARLDRDVFCLVLWAAAAGVAGDMDGFRKNWHGSASLLGSFLKTLERGTAFDLVALERLFLIVSVQLGHPFPAGEKVRFILRGLIALGVLVEAQDNSGGPVEDLYTANPSVWLFGEESGEEHRITVQPNFEIKTSPNLSLREGLMIALSCRISRFDLIPTFEIVRESVTRFFDRDYRVGDLLERFQELSSRSIPQNVLLTLQSWEAEFRKITLYEGVVLSTDGERGALLERILGEHIHKKLGNGLYLLSRDRHHEWRETLVRAGIEFLPRIRTAREEESGDGDNVPSADTQELQISGLNLSFADQVVREGSLRGAAVRDELLSALREREAGLNPEELADLKMRIEKRLILVPEQIKPRFRLSSKREARGLDYVGKIRLIEQAQKESSLLEVIERTPKGKPRRLTLKVLNVDKGAGDLVLVAELIPQHETVRIRVSKLGLVRKVEHSL